MVEELGTTASVYSSIRQRSPIFEGVKKRAMLKGRSFGYTLSKAESSIP